jgi:hypothetical protein
MTLAADEFIRRFLLEPSPSSFIVAPVPDG